MKYSQHRLSLAISCILTCSSTFANTLPLAKSGVDVLSGFNNLWQVTGAWDSGQPTSLGKNVLDTNIKTVIEIAKQRTPQQEIQAYEFDSQSANYAVIQGLGSLAELLKKETGAFTTVNGIPKEAYTGGVFDKGNGLGSSASGLGQVINFVNTVRYPASTTPAKNTYSYPRPFRQILDGEDLKWVLQPSLVARVPLIGKGDGGFPSGHTNAAYLSALGVAYTTPQQYSDMVLRAGEIGYSRVVAGIHSPLDVIGGRMHATYYAIEGLAKNPTLKQNAYQQAQKFFAEKCGGTIDACYDKSNLNQLSAQYQADKAQYDKYTFANTFAPIGDTSATPIVPINAELLIETRYPYLNKAQLREVLLTTSSARGGVLDNGMGYDTLNLFKAVNGYEAFNQKTTVDMDTAKGGLSASDIWLNDISGTGSLEKTGDGQLTLLGQNTWTNGTDLLGGTLIGNNGKSFGQGRIFNQANLVMNNAANETLSNQLLGQGQFTKQGAGTLTYRGNGTDFIGQTNIQNGTLNLQSTLNGKTTVENQGRLTGNGQLQNLDVLSGGTLDLNQSFNRLNISNDLNIDKGAILNISTNPTDAKATGGVDVGGTARLNGGTILHVGAGSNYNILSEYNILTVKKGRIGTFDQVSSNFSFLTPQLKYTDQTVTLQLLRNDKKFNSVAENTNQIQVANHLEKLGLGSQLYDVVAKQTATQARQSLNQLSGEGYTALGMNATQDLQDTARFITEQKNTESAIWLKGYGKKINNSSDTFNTQYNNYGALVGAETKINDTAYLGALLGQGKGTNKVSERGFSAKDNNTQLGVFARYENNQTGGTVGLIGRFASASVKRDIVLDSLRLKATADTDIRSGQIFGEYWIKSNTPITLEPYIRLSHIVSQVGSFKESNAGAATLSGKKSTTDTTFSTLGLRTAYQLPNALEKLSLSAGIGWTHALGDLNGVSNLSIAGLQSSYKVEGTQISKNTFVTNVGLHAEISKQFALGLTYDGEFAKDNKNNTAALNLTYKF